MGGFLFTSVLGSSQEHDTPVLGGVQVKPSQLPLLWSSPPFLGVSPLAAPTLPSCPYTQQGGGR